MPTIDERFERLDTIIEAMEQRHERFAAATSDVLSDMDDRLTRIARQNATLGKMVEVLGSYVNTSIDALQKHIRDQHDAD